MKLAVTTEGKMIFGHFGKCPCFTIAEVEQGKVLGTKLLDTSASGHEALIDVMTQEGVKVLLCGGIGAGCRRRSALLPFPLLFFSYALHR